MGNMLYLSDLDQVLGTILTQTGVDKFELVGLDACLMGHLEVLDALAPHVRYAVLSQETEPSLGWAYSSFLGTLAQNTGMDGAELGRAIVSSYIQDDQLIVDDQARTTMAQPQRQHRRFGRGRSAGDGPRRDTFGSGPLSRACINVQRGYPGTATEGCATKEHCPGA